jgi:hypothetical protein
LCARRETEAEPLALTLAAKKFFIFFIPCSKKKTFQIRPESSSMKITIPKTGPVPNGMLLSLCAKALTTNTNLSS